MSVADTSSPMIVAGHLVVDPAARDPYLRACKAVIRAAREAPGCLDFTISADPIDPGTIWVYERWASREALEAFRGDGPSAAQLDVIRSASVAEYEVGDGTAL